MLKAIIFDLDGVLIDSAPVVDSVRQEVLASYGVDIDAVPDPHRQGHRGSSLKNVLARVRQHLGITIDEQAFSKKFSEAVGKGLAAAGTTVDPGLLDLLADLQKHDIVC